MMLRSFLTTTFAILIFSTSIYAVAPFTISSGTIQDDMWLERIDKLRNQAMVEEIAGSFDTASRIWLEFLELAREKDNGRNQHRWVTDAYDSLANVSLSQLDFDGLLKYRKKSLEWALQELADEPSHIENAKVQLKIADQLRKLSAEDQAEFADANALLRYARHQFTLAETRSRLVEIAFLASVANKRFKRVVGENHLYSLHAAQLSMDLGRPVSSSQRLDELQRIYRSMKEIFGEQHPDTRSCLARIAIQHSNAGELELAETFFRKLIDNPGKSKMHRHADAQILRTYPKTPASFSVLYANENCSIAR